MQNEIVESQKIEMLESASKSVRKRILKMLAHANKDEIRGGHAGGSLSCVEIMVALYFERMKGGDRFLLSKGHAAPCLYSVLAEKGLIKEDQLTSLRRLGGLGGHPNFYDPGVDFPSGSLGQLLSVGIGMALANRDSTIYVLLGDGELQEGQIWEAAMCAGHYKIHNLVAIVDRNGLQETGLVRDIMDIEPLGDKFRSFGWNVREADGHDFRQMLGALNTTQADCPTAIIANTVKGKGVGFMENVVGWHGIHDAKKLECAI